MNSVRAPSAGERIHSSAEICFSGWLGWVFFWFFPQEKARGEQGRARRCRSGGCPRGGGTSRSRQLLALSLFPEGEPSVVWGWDQARTHPGGATQCANVTCGHLGSEAVPKSRELTSNKGRSRKTERTPQRFGIGRVVTSR